MAVVFKIWLRCALICGRLPSISNVRDLGLSISDRALVLKSLPAQFSNDPLQVRHAAKDMNWAHHWCDLHIEAVDGNDERSLCATPVPLVLTTYRINLRLDAE